MEEKEKESRVKSLVAPRHIPHSRFPSARARCFARSPPRRDEKLDFG